jgi:hypothetical protein
MALIGFAQLDTNNNFFDPTSAQGSFSRFRGQLWVSTSRAGATSRGKHTRVRKHQHKHVFLQGFHLLNSRLFGGGKSFHEQNRQHFFVKRVEHLEYHLDSKARESHNTT